MPLRANDLPSGAIDPLVRAVALRGVPALADRLGGDGAALLERFRVPPEALDTYDAMIPARTLARVLETAAAELGRPDFGLLLAEQRDTGVLGPLSIALENSADLGEALDTATRFLFVHSPALRVERIADPEGQAGTIGLLYAAAAPAPASAQLVDLGLGVFHRIIVLLAGGHYGLRSVHLPHPALAPAARYVEHFGTDVRFERPAAVLRVPERLLATELRDRNPILREITLDYLATHFTDPGRSTSDQVRQVLTRSLGSAPVRIGAVARLLAVPQRTLQRRLAAEATTFDAVLDGVRRATAERLITGTDLPLTQVTALVGFTEQSALTRAAHRWFGRSPRSLRREAAGRPDRPG